MGIGLKDTKHVQPKVSQSRNEIAFFVKTNTKVDELFLAWKEKGISFDQEPTQLTFGYTFFALDPDSNRLRIIALGKTE